MDRGVGGLYAYHGQEVVVDTIDDTIIRPQRGVLAWNGNLYDQVSSLMLGLCNPVLPNVVPPGTVPPVFLQLV